MFFVESTIGTYIHYNTVISRTRCAHLYMYFSFPDIKRFMVKWLYNTTRLREVNAKTQINVFNSINLTRATFSIKN